jgi:pyridinium-3,5-biscarboxylic acid mononucleotide sulfurtransferase
LSELTTHKSAELQRILGEFDQVAVAVSGGVDSMTLAHAAHERLRSNATMFHAVSAAVPQEATERVRRHALRYGWNLKILDAGELADPEYVANPVNRCFHCKSHLYGAIFALSEAVIISGTNLDDMCDFRPGLDAARRYGVRHPFVEARIDKAMVRSIARTHELHEITGLPASPCLSSRVETGIPITGKALHLVHAIETLLTRTLRVTPVRCRIRSEGLVIELGEEGLGRACSEEASELRLRIEQLGLSAGYTGEVQYQPYRMGSAFLRGTS